MAATETGAKTFNNFIDGESVPAAEGRTSDILNPADGKAFATAPDSGTEDVERAVKAARAAFDEWSTKTPGMRAEAMLKLADALEEHGDELAELEARNAGKPLQAVKDDEIPALVDNIRFFAGAARNLEGRGSAEYSAEHTSAIRREPIGVIGSIAPWNYPLQMGAWKILPAIAAGNTIVLKPSELTPLTSVLFAEAAQEAGIPDGVINIVTGTGPVAGQALITHPDVAMVSFTGSTAVGRQIAAQAAGSVKRVHLELGGKAPFVVFDDADVEAAARGAVAGALINAGQDCTAATRAYVQRPLYEAFVARVAALMDDVRFGPLDDPATDMGSLISLKQRDKVASMVDAAREAGATVVCGGRAAGGAFAAGAYYEPTLITDAAQDSAIVQQEIFGPVLVALPFDTDDEALRLANDTPYGLAASAWTSNVFRAGRASREIQAGTVWINDHIPIISEMPHGGYKASGFGKDMSAYAFDEYTNIKHVMTEITGEQHKGWHDVIFTSR
jgi:betaine-aldehyde dehydrogenase